MKVLYVLLWAVIAALVIVAIMNKPIERTPAQPISSAIPNSRMLSSPLRCRISADHVQLALGPIVKADGIVEASQPGSELAFRSIIVVDEIKGDIRAGCNTQALNRRELAKYIDVQNEWRRDGYIREVQRGTPCELLGTRKIEKAYAAMVRVPSLRVKGKDAVGWVYQEQIEARTE